MIVVTGDDNPETQSRALRLGAKGYFGKPVDDNVLLAATALPSPAGGSLDREQHGESIENEQTYAFLTAMAVAIAATTVAAAADSFVDPYTLANRAEGNAVARIGDVPVTVSIRTDERYNNRGLFSGPRGWAYWNYLEDPKGYQNPNLWPDKRPTYLFGEMTLPAGAELTIKGGSRMCGSSISRFTCSNATPSSTRLAGRSTVTISSPTRVPPIPIASVPTATPPTAISPSGWWQRQRRPTPRTGRRTLSIWAIDSTVFGGFRMYVSDHGFDGTGWGPGGGPNNRPPGLTYTATLADGTRLSEDDATRRFGKAMGDAPPPIDADKWYKLISNPANPSDMTPATAPASPMCSSSCSPA